MLFYLLLFIAIFLFPVSSIVLMVRSWIVDERTTVKKVHVKIMEVLCFIAMVGFLWVGFLFNSYGVAGGLPLQQSELTGNFLDGYATLSNDYVVTVICSLILSGFAYWALKLTRGALSPMLLAAASVLLIANVIFAIVYFSHIGFGHYGDDSAGATPIILLHLGFACLIGLYTAELKHSANAFMHRAQQEEIVYSSKWLRFMDYFRQKYSRLPLLWSIAFFPVMLIVQLLLVLFGQRPDSFIRVFLETSSFHYSQLPVPPPTIVPGNGHYLCTVSVRGHRKIVKPLRAGLRHGSRIVVNRQLLVANAFENIIEQYAPRAHKIIRRCYDKYGYPLSKHINQPWSADVVYLLMKPLEWFFLAVLYTVDRNPENRIHRQYSELRK
ncbi:hypothetical protein SAMN04487969_108129 [Paenibacillus algorifonticola]|uniref:Uncharacterized protein n=1 Tax=Paenibacillus algorifonticola TaxID=684063 RepID=A0A1I2E285_9BACL|nr:DUF6688 family protein [Paenibacillus algorifonticola]SFE86807.1 hypothetical protein SAMN04487969_108129 [Paenibacillus algorifonticola]